MRRVVLMVAMILLLLAVKTGAPARADIDGQDQIFIDALARNSAMHYGSPYKAISVANSSVCGGLDNGESWPAVISDVAAQTNWPEFDSEFFVGAAVQTYCPQYVSLIPAPDPPPAEQPATADLVAWMYLSARPAGSYLS